MNFFNKKIENGICTVKSVLDSKTLESYFPRAYDKIKENVQVEGFRKGKVPLSIFLKKYNKGMLYEESINYALRDIYIKFLEENKDLQIISQPDINILDFKPEKDIEIELKMILKPEVKLANIEDIKLTNLDEKIYVTEDDINNKLNQLLDNYSHMEVIEEEAQINDTLSIDFKGYIDKKPFPGGESKNYSLVIGANTFIPGFEEQLIGMKEEDKKTINVTFPQDYHSKDFAGKKAEFEIIVNSVKRKVTPEFNNELFEKISKKLNQKVNKLDEIKEILKDEIYQVKLKQKKEESKSEITTQLITKSSFFIPEKLIENQFLETMEKFRENIKKQNIKEEDYYKMSNITKEDFEKSIKDDIKKQYSSQLVMEKYIDENKINITDEEIQKYINENYKGNLPSNDNLKNIYPDLKYILTIDKALDDIINKIKINVKK